MVSLGKRVFIMTGPNMDFELAVGLRNVLIISKTLANKMMQLAAERHRVKVYLNLGQC